MQETGYDYACRLEGGKDTSAGSPYFPFAQAGATKMLPSGVARMQWGRDAAYANTPDRLVWWLTQVQMRRVNVAPYHLVNVKTTHINETTSYEYEEPQEWAWLAPERICYAFVHEYIHMWQNVWRITSPPYRIGYALPGEPYWWKEGFAV